MMRDCGILSPAQVFSLLLFIGLTFLLVHSLAPQFVGGGFIIVVLGISCIAVLLILVTAWVPVTFRGSRHLGTKDGQSLQRTADPGQDLDWRGFANAIYVTVVLLGSTLVLGMYVGPFVFLTFALSKLGGMAWPKATATALVLGALIPWAFSSAVGVRLWPGLVPVLVPELLGGGMLPAL